jgi:hypothetical protein
MVGDQILAQDAAPRWVHQWPIMTADLKGLSLEFLMTRALTSHMWCQQHFPMYCHSLSLTSGSLSIYTTTPSTWDPPFQKAFSQAAKATNSLIMTIFRIQDLAWTLA